MRKYDWQRDQRGDAVGSRGGEKTYAGEHETRRGFAIAGLFGESKFSQ